MIASKLTFPCPVCAVDLTVDLLALARAGSLTCAACRRRLSAQDVSRAMHAPRKKPA